MIPELFDENVQPTMPILYLLHHGLDLRRLRHVAFNHQRLIEFTGYIGRIGLILSLRVGHIIHHALRAALAKCLDHLCANPARAPGDEHDFCR